MWPSNFEVVVRQSAIYSQEWQQQEIAKLLPLMKRTSEFYDDSPQQLKWTRSALKTTHEICQNIFRFTMVQVLPFDFYCGSSSFLELEHNRLTDKHILRMLQIVSKMAISSFVVIFVIFWSFVQIQNVLIVLMIKRLFGINKSTSLWEIFLRYFRP